VPQSKASLHRCVVDSAAAQIGLDVRAFEACVPKIDALVEEDVQLANSLGITGTPAFILGKIGPDGLVKASKTIRGAQPLEVFTKELDALVNAGRQ
jgi:protein-disulfide isomerase